MRHKIALSTSINICIALLVLQFAGYSKGQEPHRAASAQVSENQSPDSANLPHYYGDKKPAHIAIMLVYHYVHPASQSAAAGIKPTNYLRIDPETFAKHLDILQEAKIPIMTLSHYLQNRSTIKGRVAVLTFDDNTIDQYRHVFKIMSDRKLKGTLCVNTGTVGTGPQFMNWEQLKKMAGQGWDIVNHTHTHARTEKQFFGLIPKQDESETKFKERVKFDVETDQKLIEKKLGTKLRVLALPFGFYDKQTIKLLHEMGFDTVLTVDEGVNTQETPAGYLRRRSVFAKDSLDDFKMKVTCEPLTILEPSPGRGEFLKTPPDSIKFQLGGIQAIDNKRLTTELDLKPVSFEISDPVFASVIVKNPLKNSRKKTGFHIVTIKYRGEKGVEWIDSWGFVVKR